VGRARAPPDLRREFLVIVLHEGPIETLCTEHELRDSSENAEDTAANHLSLATDDPTRLEDSRFVMGSDDLADAFHLP